MPRSGQAENTERSLLTWPQQAKIINQLIGCCSSGLKPPCFHDRGATHASRYLSEWVIDWFIFVRQFAERCDNFND
jgi:hypothetical protein